MKYKQITLSVLSIFFSLNLFSQVGGISASKLVAINTETVPANKIEFEPSLNFSIANNDSTQTESEFGFRFTYGLSSKLEAGIYVPINLNTVNWGVKYNLVTFNKLSFGLFAGLQNSLNYKTSSDNFLNTFATGITFTYKLNDKLSIDFSGQFENHFHEYKKDKGIFINSEIGYFIFEGLQLVTGFQYEKHDLSSYKEEGLTINSGITVEKAENFILVLNVPYLLRNKYTDSSLGFSMALTILIH